MTGRFLKRFTILAVIALVVLGLGLIVSEQDAQRPSFSVQAQHTAAQAADELADNADRLAEDGRADVLHSAADVLHQHAALLRVPGPTGGTQPSSESEESQKIPNEGEFVAALRTSAERNLAAAEQAEPGIARLLASTGTAQWILANEMSPSPEPPPSPEKPPSTPATDPPCTEPGKPGTETLAVGSVRQAEHRAAYAYEVAAGRVGTPAFQDKIQSHHAAADRLTEFLKALCSEAPPPVEAYVLHPNYFKDSASSLSTMESELLVSYADLVGLSNGAVRHWAISRLMSATLAQHRPGSAPDPTPGIENQAGPGTPITGKSS